MKDWAEHLIAAKASIVEAEKRLSLQNMPSGAEALYAARDSLWEALDIINAKIRNAPR